MTVTDHCMRQAGLDAYIDNHPPFRDLVTRFGRLLCAQRAASETLPTALEAGGVVDESVFLTGEPLSARLDLTFFLDGFKRTAQRLWPFMGEAFPVLREPLDRLTAALDQESWRMECLAASVQGDAEALRQSAVRADVEPDILLFALRTAYSPCITALRPGLASQPLVTLWRKCFCPVCGSDPDVGTLELHPDEKSYVVSQSPESWLHCPQCDHRWRFARAVCPSCGNQETDTLTRFSLPENPREFIYTCDACRRYLPYIDLSGSRDDEFRDLSFTALKLVHLDAAAQERGYAPLSPAPWTTLGFQTQAVSAQTDRCGHQDIAQ